MDLDGVKSSCVVGQSSRSPEKNNSLQDVLEQASAPIAQHVLVSRDLLLEFAELIRRLAENSLSDQLVVELLHPPSIRCLPKDKEFLSRQELADILNVPVPTLASWAYTGKPELPFVRLGKLIRYRVSDVERFLEENTSTTS